MLEKVLLGIARSCIFALPFIVFIVTSSLFFPFITGKNFTFRILIEIVAGAWLALAIIDPKYRPRRSLVLFAVSAFVVAIGIADALGINPAKSFGSNYERMDGWVTLAHLAVYFMAAVSLMDAVWWKRWWQTSLGVSVLVGLYGLMQLLGLTAINQGTARIDATLGNATYLAVYMLFHVFIAALMQAKVWQEKGIRLSTTWVYGSIILFDGYILFFTATRGAMLGVVGGAVLAGILYLIADYRSRSARYVAVFLGAILVLAAIFWSARDTQFVRTLGPLERIATISLTDTTTSSRFMNAGMAWEGFKERPIFGWGQEHYAAVFDKYYNPNMWGQEPWFDRVHNIVFDWLIAGGLVGLLAYLSLYLTALWLLWRSGAFTLAERAILTGLLAAYFFYLLFTFDNIMSYILFFAVLGYITVRGSQDTKPLLEDSRASRNYLPAIAIVTIVLSVVSIWTVNVNAIAANRAIILGLSSHPSGYAQNLEYFKESIAYGTFGTQEAREHLSQTAARFASADIQAPPEIRQQFLDTAVTEMQKQIEEVPESARFPLFLGILLNAFGRYDDARQALEQARVVSPNKQSIRFELALNALARGQTEEGLRMLEEAHALAPLFPQAQVLLVSTAVRSGQIERVEPIIALLKNEAAVDQRVLSALASQKRYDKIVILADRTIASQPDNAQAYFTRAAALYLLNDKTAATETLQLLKAKMPQTAAQVDPLIRQIQEGTLNVQ